MIRLSQRVKGTLPIAGACLLASVIAVGLTGWLSLGIALWNFAPETLILGDNWAPLCALFVAGWSLKRAGWQVGVWAVAFWSVAWLVLLGRFSPASWWHDGILNLTFAH